MSMILDGLTSFFRTPEIAAIAAQSVQAAELATRQGIASIQRDAQHRENMVVTMDASDPTEPTGQRQAPLELQESKRKTSARKEAPVKGPQAWPRHQVDITV